jgi:hypothetical protein
MHKGNVREGPYTRAEQRLLSKAVLCALCGSAAEARLLNQRGRTVAAMEIFLTKADDQAFVWELAGKRWASNTARRNRMVELLAAVATQVVSRNTNRIDRVAEELLRLTDLSVEQVRELM